MGYITELIDTEPNNYIFADYLDTLGFEKVLHQETNEDHIYDKEAYELLFDTAIELNKAGKPFFLSVYTFDTHMTYDSYDKKFGDGKNPLLNKFYNVDYHFGEFINKYKASDLYDNTIIIFTSDHASYTDQEYLETFESYYDRFAQFLDRIPLLIYHKDIQPYTYDVMGRNSLDLVPTILDYIDVSAPNYFLGKSLFADSGTKYDTIFYDATVLQSSDNNTISYYDINNDALMDDLKKYFSVSTRK